MTTYIWGDSQTEFFFQLTPDLVLDAIELLGLNTTGRCLTLNSLENRVYEIEIENNNQKSDSPSDNFIVAKFYRPGRWSRQQIQEEHDFLHELADEEIPAIAPIKFKGETLFKMPQNDIWYTLFPKKGGRNPEEMNQEQLEIMGRLLARIHSIGARVKATHRLEINPDSFGINNINYLLQNNFIPPHQRTLFQKTCLEICEKIAPLFKDLSINRIHGDCHKGNIIFRNQDCPYFIDFDDMLVGPAIQDIWLLVPGNEPEDINNKSILLDSYQTMREFDQRELKLIEPLRTLRYIHFAAWTAKRWDDPSFKHAFCNFGSNHYWDTLLNDLQIQLGKINDILIPPSYWY